MQRRFAAGAVGLAAGLLAIGVGEAGPGGEKPTINWATSWEMAVKEATARNVPIFVTFHKDN